MSTPLLRGWHKRRSKLDLFDYWSLTLYASEVENRNGTPGHAGRCENCSNSTRVASNDWDPAKDTSGPTFINDQTRSQGQVIDQQPILTDSERGRLDIGSGGPLLGNGLPDMEFTTTGMTPERPNAYKDSWPIPTCQQPDF